MNPLWGRRPLAAFLSFVTFSQCVLAPAAAAQEVRALARPTDARPLAAAARDSFGQGDHPSISAPTLSESPAEDAVPSGSSADVVVHERWSPPGSRQPTVWLVEDVHMNAEAQAHIATFLRGLSRGGALAWIGVEGAWAPFDRSVFAAFDPASLRRVAEAALSAGRLAAPSVLALTDPDPFIAGVDEATDHAASVAAVRAAAARRPALLSLLAKERRRLADVEARTLAPSARQFEAAREAHANGRLDWADYVASLVQTGARPNATLVRFLEAARLERTLDAPAAEAGRAAWMRRLLPALSPAERAEIARRSIDERLGREEAVTFYRRLLTIGAGHGVSVPAGTPFGCYLAYLEASAQLSAPAVQRSALALERAAERRVARTDADARLLAESDRLELVGKLLRFSLTPVEWSAYCERAAGRGHAFFPEASPLEPFENFYLLADRRSDRFARRAEQWSRVSPSSMGALVIGGFHAEAVAERLRERGVPYAIVSPKLARADVAGAADYLSIFERDRTPVEWLLSGSRLFLAPPQENIADSATAAGLWWTLFREAGWRTRAAALRIVVRHRRALSPQEVVQRLFSERRNELISAAAGDPSLSSDLQRALRRLDRWIENDRLMAERYPEHYARFLSLVVRPMLQYDAERLNLFLASSEAAELNSLSRFLRHPIEDDESSSDIAFELDELRDHPINWEAAYGHEYLAGYPIVLENATSVTPGQRETLNQAMGILGDIIAARPRPAYLRALAEVQSIIPISNEAHAGRSGVRGHPEVDVAERGPLRLATAILHEAHHQWAHLQGYGTVEADGFNRPKISIPAWQSSENESMTPYLLIDELLAYGADSLVSADEWTLHGFDPEFDLKPLIMGLEDALTAEEAFRVFDGWTAEGFVTPKGQEWAAEARAMWEESIPVFIQVAVVTLARFPRFASSDSGAELRALAAAVSATPLAAPQNAPPSAPLNRASAAVGVALFGLVAVLLHLRGAPGALQIGAVVSAGFFVLVLIAVGGVWYLGSNWRAMRERGANVAGFPSRRAAVDFVAHEASPKGNADRLLVNPWLFHLLHSPSAVWGYFLLNVTLTPLHEQGHATSFFRELRRFRLGRALDELEALALQGLPVFIAGALTAFHPAGLVIPIVWSAVAFGWAWRTASAQRALAMAALETQMVDAFLDRHWSLSEVNRALEDLRRGSSYPYPLTSELRRLDTVWTFAPADWIRMLETVRRRVEDVSDGAVLLHVRGTSRGEATATVPFVGSADVVLKNRRFRFRASDAGVTQSLSSFMTRVEKVTEEESEPVFRESKPEVVPIEPGARHALDASTWVEITRAETGWRLTVGDAGSKDGLTLRAERARTAAHAPTLSGPAFLLTHSGFMNLERRFQAPQAGRERRFAVYDRLLSLEGARSEEVDFSHMVPEWVTAVEQDGVRYFVRTDGIPRLSPEALASAAEFYQPRRTDSSGVPAWAEREDRRRLRLPVPPRRGVTVQYELAPFTIVAGERRYEAGIDDDGQPFLSWIEEDIPHRENLDIDDATPLPGFEPDEAPLLYLHGGPRTDLQPAFSISAVDAPDDLEISLEFPFVGYPDLFHQFADARRSPRPGLIFGETGIPALDLFLIPFGEELLFGAAAGWAGSWTVLIGARVLFVALHVVFGGDAPALTPSALRRRLSADVWGVPSAIAVGALLFSAAGADWTGGLAVHLALNAAVIGVRARARAAAERREAARWFVRFAAANARGESASAPRLGVSGRAFSDRRDERGAALFRRWSGSPAAWDEIVRAARAAFPGWADSDVDAALGGAWGALSPVAISARALIAFRGAAPSKAERRERRFRVAAALARLPAGAIITFAVDAGARPDVEDALRAVARQGRDVSRVSVSPADDLLAARVADASLLESRFGAQDLVVWPAALLPPAAPAWMVSMEEWIPVGPIGSTGWIRAVQSLRSAA